MNKLPAALNKAPTSQLHWWDMEWIGLHWMRLTVGSVNLHVIFEGLYPMQTLCPKYMKNFKSLDWTLWVALSSLFSHGFLGSPFRSEFLWGCVRDVPLLSESSEEPDQAVHLSSAASCQIHCSHIKPRLEHTHAFCFTPVSQASSPSLT